jgi:glutathione S-transferase
MAYKNFPRRQGLKPNEERVSELLGLLQSKMDVYNVILGKQKYLAGDVRRLFFFWLTLALN